VFGEPLAHDARYHEQDDEIGGDRTEPDVEGPVRREKGDDRVDDVRPLGQDLGDDVNDQERQRAEGEGTVHGLRHHPVSGRHDDAVRGQQAQQHRTCQADEREHPGVVQHEALRSCVNLPAGLGRTSTATRTTISGDQGGRDLPRMWSPAAPCAPECTP
jgi:hypothetical protein